MDVIGDLVARDRRSERTALRVASHDRDVSYHDFCTTAYKAGNVLRYLGVGRERVVAVAAQPAVHPVWAFVGAAQLGAVTRFVPVESLDAVAGARVVLTPVEAESAVDDAPGTKLATYGGAPAQSTTLHWETELWSENPAVHPTAVDPADAALVADGAADGSDATYTHRRLVTAAAALAERLDADEETRVVLRGSLADPGVVVGLLAPLLVGGTAVLTDTDEAPPTPAGDVAVVGSDAPPAPESRAVDAAVLLAE